MANRLPEFGIMLLRVTKADGTKTTVSLHDDEYFLLHQRYPEMRERVDRLHAASHAYDRAGQPGKGRSAFVRKALLG